MNLAAEFPVPESQGFGAAVRAVVGATVRQTQGHGTGGGEKPTGGDLGGGAIAVAKNGVGTAKALVDGGCAGGGTVVGGDWRGGVVGDGGSGLVAGRLWEFAPQANGN